VFGNADSGEGYITVDGNEGDRKNLTLWQNAEHMISAVASECNNTIVVLHTVGPVLVESWVDHPNITAILWAGLPGQESGNSLVDVLYGAVNPGAKSPFTWGKTRADYGAALITVPNNGAGSPQQDFTEGIFVDYRHFDKSNITPRWEFGYGLSYTSFQFSNIEVQALQAPPYTPARGQTKAAPTLGKVGTAADYLVPAGFHEVPLYIYPYLNSTDLKAASGDPHYGWPTDQYVPPHAADSSPQTINPAGGAPGGNPRLYDEVAKVTVTIKNSGKVVGDEIPQLYISLGGPDDAPKVLRGFERVTLHPGQSTKWTATIVRRDVMNWDTTSQNWVVTQDPKTVYVGRSSRDLPLQAPLHLK
jgi:beta-glucosidase